jgi:hypothetical protein
MDTIAGPTVGNQRLGDRDRVRGVKDPSAGRAHGIAAVDGVLDGHGKMSNDRRKSSAAFDSPITENG